MSSAPNGIAERLMEAAGGDADIALQLAGLFVTELARLVADVRAAASSGNWPGLQHAAHTLTGAAGTLGFAEVAERARALETLARGGMIDAAVVPGEVERLSAASDDLDRAVRAYLGERP